LPSGDTVISWIERLACARPDGGRGWCAKACLGCVLPGGTGWIRYPLCLTRWRFALPGALVLVVAIRLRLPVPG
jgi:hypothetical protein